MSKVRTGPLPGRGCSLLLSLVPLLFACQDEPPTGPDVPGPLFDISEARFGDGNPDFFFSTPLAATPGSGDANFDEGAANELLVPYVRVCETDGAATFAGCTADVTAAVTGSDTGLAMSFNSGSELYQVNWKTDALDTEKEYRIEVWGLAFQESDRNALLEITFPDDHSLLPGRPRWLFGWRDIDNSPSTASCDGSEEFCLINYGQNLPVKVRIEDFVFCPLSRNCAVQFVAAGTDANLEAALGDELVSSAQLFIPGQSGTDFALAFEPCSEEEDSQVSQAIDLPTFGPCVKTLVPPTAIDEIDLTEPVTLSLCTITHEEEDAIRGQLADPASLEELKLHHFSTGGVPGGEIIGVEAWPEVAAACGEPTSGGLAAAAAPTGFMDRALALGERVLALDLFRPRRLVALDQGGGGQGFGVFSFYKLALPAKFEYEEAGDDFRTAPAGSDVTLRARVTDLGGRPVEDARVKWNVISSPGGDAEVLSSPVPTNSGGISETTVTLSATSGDNVFHATGKGIADDREEGCTLPGGTPGEASCNGPRIAFDPFQPNTSALDGGVEVIPDGTRLPFTVRGCEPGRGTPEAIDGTLSDGEWECAQTRLFPVNVSGGSTVQATLFWMNDDESVYLAVSVPGTDRQNGLRLDFDNVAPAGETENEIYSGTRTVGDDVWEFDPGAGPADRFIDPKCSESSQSGCGESDAGFGGSMDTNAAFSSDAVQNVTVYEISHPRSTGQTCVVPGKGQDPGVSTTCDLEAGGADHAFGVFVTLRMGSGAQGNTQWPGFLTYLTIEIH